MDLMNKMNQIQNEDEIELFEILNTLWNGKWIISSVVVIAVVLGCCFLSLKDAVYESKLIYSIDNLPPFYNQEKVSADFQKKFYLKSIFESWKKNYSDTSLLFEDFNAEQVVQGFIFSRSDNKKLATMREEKMGVSSIIVKTNKFQILDDFYKYATHVNNELTRDYILRANDELKIIEKRYNKINVQDSIMVNDMLSLERYIDTAYQGSSVFAVQRPSMPRKVSMKSSVTIGLSIVLGILGGVFLVLFSNVLKMRKE